jgi:hypothetical protein
MTAEIVQLELESPFTLVRSPNYTELEAEGAVTYLIVTGRQDDELWGPVGAMWLSADERRGGFLVHPWALWAGSEIVRGYRGALERDWTPAEIYAYWRQEVWRGSYSVEGEHSSESLLLVAELLEAL